MGEADSKIQEAAFQDLRTCYIDIGSFDDKALQEIIKILQSHGFDVGKTFVAREQVTRLTISW